MSTRPTAFEERLKAELVAIAADRAELDGRADFAVRPPARRLRIPLAVGLAATAAVGLIALPVMGDQGGTSAAYALSKRDDGTIVVRLFNPEGISGVERELRELGVPVAVVPQKPVAECSEPGGGADGPVGHVVDENGVTVSVSDEQLFGFTRDGELVLTVNERTLPAGHVVLLMKPIKPLLKWVSAVSIAPERVPSCIAMYPGGDEEVPTGPVVVPHGPPMTWSWEEGGTRTGASGDSPE
ncbi:hypothetical protein [Streptomyces sp. NPDC002082]|uniref:hypothetical protein n=1 Tax=Streptomyces sp. NPDC002082 TaxID=3154772 RepID=UPI00332513CC